MKKTDLKQILKPIVKECITEILIEEGLLSNVISEVAKGLQASQLVEVQQPSNHTTTPVVDAQMTEQSEAPRAQLKEYRKKMM